MCEWTPRCIHEATPKQRHLAGWPRSVLCWHLPSGGTSNSSIWMLRGPHECPAERLIASPGTCESPAGCRELTSWQTVLLFKDGDPLECPDHSGGSALEANLPGARDPAWPGASCSESAEYVRTSWKGFPLTCSQESGRKQVTYCLTQVGTFSVSEGQGFKEFRAKPILGTLAKFIGLPLSLKDPWNVTYIPA